MTEPAAEFGLSRIGQIAVVIHDFERAVQFYRDRLGMKLQFQFAPKLAFFDCSGIRLMLSIPEPEFDHPGSILYFTVDDIHEAHARLTERGVTFRGVPHCIAKLPDHELWMAFFDDTEGNTLALMCEVRP